MAAVASKIAPRLTIRMHAVRHAKTPNLSLQPPPAPIGVTLLKPTADEAAAAAAHLARHGYVVCSGGLQQEIIATARGEARALYSAKRFKPGSFTTDGATVAGSDKAERDDHILWLGAHCKAGQAPPPRTLAALEGAMMNAAVKILDELSKVGEGRAGGAPSDATRFAHFDDGKPLYFTGRSDMMVAVYDGQRAAYGKHIDSLDGDNRAHLDHGRCFTLVYYLNEASWDATKDGGALRVFVPPAGDTPDEVAAKGGGGGGSGSSHAAPNEAIDVPPRGDTFVLFRADRVVHEVRPSHGSRIAATIWFFGGSREQRAAAVARGAIQIG